MAESSLWAEALRSIDAQLRAAGRLLEASGQDQRAWRRAMSLLRSVEDALLALAYARSTKAATSAHLLQWRDDLSGYLLAATFVDEAARVDSGARTAILRRAIDSTMARVNVIASVTDAARAQSARLEGVFRRSLQRPPTSANPRS